MKGESSYGRAGRWCLGRAPLIIIWVIFPLFFGEQAAADDSVVRIPEGEVIVSAPELWSEESAPGFVTVARPSLKGLLDQDAVVPFGFDGLPTSSGLLAFQESTETDELVHAPSEFRAGPHIDPIGGSVLASGSAFRFGDGFAALERIDQARLGNPINSLNDVQTWGYLLPIIDQSAGQQSTPHPLRLSMPPLYAPALAAGPRELIFGGIDYSDPNVVGVPLLRVAGYRQMSISPHFTVRDFATRDGAPLARISPTLVTGLESVVRLAGPIEILSGYRHRRHNASVRGASQSRHIAGQAADIWSPTKSSLYLARQVIEGMGCRIGIGLGRSSVHIDVRGHLATWTYPGAPLSELAFDIWVRMLCSGNRDHSDALTSPIDWIMGDSLEFDLDEYDLEYNFPYGVNDPDAWFHSMRTQVAEYAASSWYRDGPGAVIMDFSSGVPPIDQGIDGVVRYVRLRSNDISDYGLYTLVDRISRQEPRRYFAYAMLLEDGSVHPGLANLNPTSNDAQQEVQQSPELPNEPEGQPESSSQSIRDRIEANRQPTAAQAAPALRSTPPGSRWGIVVASTIDAGEAERLSSQFRQLLSPTGLVLNTRVDNSTSSARYRIVAGEFESASEARGAQQRYSQYLPNDSWLLPPDQ